MTPHRTTGTSPAELLLGRRPRSRLDILHPDLVDRVDSRQAAQKRDHDARGIREQNFVGGDLVYVRDFHCSNKWVPGIIVSVTGPLSYTVKIESGVVRRHIDHLRARHNSQVDGGEDVCLGSPNDIISGPSGTSEVSPSSSEEGADSTSKSSGSGPCVHAPSELPPSIPPSIPQSSQAAAMGDSAHGVPNAGSPGVIAEDKGIPLPQGPTDTPPLHRSSRVKKPPDYYGRY